MNAIYKVSVAEGLTYQAFGDFGALKPGTRIVIQCDKFQECGTVMRQCSQEPIADPVAYEQQHAQNNKGRHIEGDKIPTFVRIATHEDRAQLQANLTKAADAFKTASDRIVFHHLEMKLIQTHYSLDRRLLVFQFSADGRVDFRELLRDLSATFKVRVELRQVGVRDEASILGGIGTCGRPFCCSTFLTGFNSINVKMAKQQGLSLNPQNISGCCGRLKCCLQYESDHYSKLAEEQKQAEKLAGDQQTSAEFRQDSPASPQNDSKEGNGPHRQQKDGKTPMSFTASPDRKQKHGDTSRRPLNHERDKTRMQDAKSQTPQPNIGQAQEASRPPRQSHGQHGQPQGQPRHGNPSQGEGRPNQNRRPGNVLVNLKNGSEMPNQPHPKDNSPRLVSLTNGGEQPSTPAAPHLVSLTDKPAAPHLLSLTDKPKPSASIPQAPSHPASSDDENAE